MTSRRGYTPKAIPQRAISSKAFREAARVPEFYLVSVTRCDPHGRILDADGGACTAPWPRRCGRLPVGGCCYSVNGERVSRLSVAAANDGNFLPEAHE